MIYDDAENPYYPYPPDTPAAPPPPQPIDPGGVIGREIPSPTTAAKPTQPFPIDQRPPKVDPNSEWDDTWWDGRSPYLGGWLVKNSTHPLVPTSPTPTVGGNPYQPQGDTGAVTLEFPDYVSAGAFQPRNSTFTFERYQPTAFTPNPYTPSNWADAENEPGYQDSQKRLLRSIEQGAANQGILRSGMTLGREAYGLNDFKQQNFRNFDDRRFRNFITDEGNRFSAWKGNEESRLNAWRGNLEGDEWKFLTEYGIDKDVYDRRATDVDRRNNFSYNVADARHRDALSRWQTMVDSLTRISTTYPS